MSLPLLSARDLAFAYADVPTLSEINLTLDCGGLRALIGPNGSGKTTLLRVLIGLLPPTHGVVEYQGVDLRSLTRREIAKRIALVPQELNLTYGFTVAQIVMLGRTPHVSALAGPTKRDRDIVAHAMELTETASLADRLVTELSGGERQRVIIAMALAQEPQVLLLDEPTVHLDINHQMEILELLRRLNRERGLTVLATMHDLNLASLYFDDLILLERGRIVAMGTPAQVLNPERIRAVFQTSVQVQPHPTRAHSPQVILLPQSRD